MIGGQAHKPQLQFKNKYINKSCVRIMMFYITVKVTISMLQVVR